MNLLVIRFSSAGDIVLTSLFLRALRKRFPDATIHFLTKQEFLPLVEKSPYLNRAIAINNNAGRTELSQQKLALVQELGKKYDAVYDLHNSLRSKLFRAGIAKRIEVLRKPSIRKRLLVWFKWNFLRPIVPIPELYLRVGKPDGLMNDGEGLQVFIGDTASPLPPVHNHPTIGFAPGSRHRTKQWPPERFVELGKQLRERYHARIVLFGSPQEAELCQTIADGIAQGSPLLPSPIFPSPMLPSPINLAGITTWLPTAAALDQCQLVVTNDSSIAHLAAARKRKVVALFGSTVQEFGFAPYGTQSAVVEVSNLDCRPCTTIGRAECPHGHFRCMMELTVDHVMDKIEEMLPAAR